MTAEADARMIVAIVRPGKLNAVKQALAGAGAPSLTVTNVSGRGSQPVETGTWRGEEHIVDLHQKIKVEVVVEASAVDGVVAALRDAARTGDPGDGKIFVLPVYDVVQVRTGDRGLDAL